MLTIAAVAGSIADAPPTYSPQPDEAVISGVLMLPVPRSSCRRFMCRKGHEK